MSVQGVPVPPNPPTQVPASPGSRVPVFEYVPVFSTLNAAKVRILSITGLSTRHDDSTTDRGRLYGSVTFAGGLWTVDLYSDFYRSSGSKVLTGAGFELGGIFDLGPPVGPGMSARAVVDAYTADDATLVALPTLATDMDVFKSIDECAAVPHYHSRYGFAFYHADALRRIMTSDLPAALPHLFGKTGLAAFIPQTLSASMPDLTKIAAVGQLRSAQGDLAKALVAKDSLHMPGFAEMYAAAMASFQESMNAIKAANIEEVVEAAQEQADDLSVSVGTFSRF